eukprot:CAMPEP_0117788286 /NCGR_PEP_ID=MMETSP0948-20121206/6920_1 /TAXON_ID=44440 /ORGANISM="Chattonella subsalsa, Strain CCMP2191" /LENGTH=79 /DNA_ID=CAMNT_0005617617 /DNA_START=154 /DNA_END=393 /DNA_ORIENTATION=-
MAKSAASKLSKDTNPNPFEFPVSGSRMILGVVVMNPNAEKVSYSSFSSTSGSKFPMNKLAPTSSVFLSWLALFTRIGFP